MKSHALLLLLPAAAAGELLWPLGWGDEPYPLRATYGQLEGEKSNVDLHYGLDIAAEAKAEAVYALEDGKVAKVYTDQGYRSGILIDSGAGALLYLHLEGETIPFVKGDVVAKDDYLGDVVYSDTYTGVRHLHLSRLPDTNHLWSGMDRFSSGNPLLELDPELLGDEEPPKILELEGEERFAVRANEDPYSTRAPQYFDLDALPAKALDVIVRVREHDGSGAHELAPYRVELSIEPKGGGASPLLFDVLLDGALKPFENSESALYNLDSVYPSGDGKAYYVLTNAAAGAKPKAAGCWESEPGTYTLRVTVRDVAGKVDSYERTVTVVP